VPSGPVVDGRSGRIVGSATLAVAATQPASRPRRRELRTPAAPGGVARCGYTIFNDWSARDLQVHELKVPMGPSKSKDSAPTLGPWLVTADELADLVVDGRLA